MSVAKSDKHLQRTNAMGTNVKSRVQTNRLQAFNMTIVLLINLLMRTKKKRRTRTGNRRLVKFNPHLINFGFRDLHEIKETVRRGSVQFFHVLLVLIKK